MNGTPETLSQTPQPAAELAGTTRRNPLLIGLVVVILLFAVTYLVAWLRSSAMTQDYLEYADQRYQQGNYLEALAGYQEFDQQNQRYITRGGYFHVQRIWANRYAWPVPAGVEVANQRIDEIINEKINIVEAEQFIQTTSGRNDPYLGLIYLRLGELYEQEGDLDDARDVYEEIPSLFANEPDLIERAKQHLQRLDSQ